MANGRNGQGVNGIQNMGKIPQRLSFLSFR